MSDQVYYSVENGRIRLNAWYWLNEVPIGEIPLIKNKVILGANTYEDILKILGLQELVGQPV